jgi:MFS family permease
MHPNAGTPRANHTSDANGVIVQENQPTSAFEVYEEAAEAVTAEVVAESRLEPSDETEPPRVGVWFIAVYMVTYFGLNLTMLLPALFSIAYKVQLIDPVGKEASLGLVLGLGGLLGLVLGPVCGVLSDSTRVRWGRRRTWHLAGIVISALGALVIAMSPNVPLMIVGYGISQLGLAAFSAGFNPVLAERVPSSQRGKVGALGGVAAALAGVGAYLLGAQLTGNIYVLFLLPVVVFAAASVVFFFTVKDGPAPARTTRPSARELFGSFLFNPKKYSDFALVWLGKFCLQFGFTFFSAYQLYLLLDRLGFTPEEAAGQLALVSGISLLAMMGFAVLGGFLSDKLRRRKVFIYIAAALIASGLAVAAFAPNFALIAIGGILLSAGTGAFTSVDLAMATDLLPEKDKAGKYMSIYYISATIPGTLAPLIAPVILLIGGAEANYTALFLFGAVLSLGAIITTWKVRAVR